MARRKRLELPAGADAPAPETKSAYSGLARMPIAEVAGDTSARAALDEMSAALRAAEAEGRMARRVPIDRIELRHLNRDRMVLDPEELEVLKSSLAARGQQAPIELLQLSSGRFGLISGLRRLEALKSLGEIEALAFIRRPESAGASYVAMVEENEIRAPLSFYERANIAVQAVGAGVFRDVHEAVRALFAAAAPAKRSKILRFVLVRQHLGSALAFPAAIPEKLGLALASALEADSALGSRIKDSLRKAPPADAAAERRVLERSLKRPAAPPARGEEVAPGVILKAAQGKLTLAGTGVDADLVEALKAWLATR